jgi:hypothetical protein
MDNQAFKSKTPKAQGFGHVEEDHVEKVPTFAAMAAPVGAVQLHPASPLESDPERGHEGPLPKANHARAHSVFNAPPHSKSLSDATSPTGEGPSVSPDLSSPNGSTDGVVPLDNPAEFLSPMQQNFKSGPILLQQYKDSAEREAASRFFAANPGAGGSSKADTRESSVAPAFIDENGTSPLAMHSDDEDEPPAAAVDSAAPVVHHDE